MRLVFCSILLLTACASHDVRCDAHLRPINPPASSANTATQPAQSPK
jgi:hypothetical protein